ncbi:MAG TPA: fused MFS/spermidine synthase [Anaerolineae bacterium]|nr:fused MFS/spermidine synthase [Anaerolineae bacterium]HQI83860.1 fused MFS/spermidine synthase [Anaerolineae bacterium]
MIDKQISQQTEDNRPAVHPQPWYWQPNLIVFISSGCIMILELVAGRIIAPSVGVSLYTWTSVIGVILAGISLGNYIGGRLADRWASPRLLGLMFFLAGLTALGILVIDQLNPMDHVAWPLILEILALIAVLFLLPCSILGTVSPIVVKLAMRDLARAGRTVGQIYAFGTVGSIVGTFLTGFWLIAQFGTYMIVVGVSIVLLCLGLLFLLGRRWWGAALVLPLLIGGALWAEQRGWLAGPCMYETNYFCIKVKEEEREGEIVRTLILDRLVHSYTSLDNPTKLVYGYERVYAELTAHQAARHDALRALFIGGGGYTFPKYMELLYPDSTLDVIEIDPGVTRVAYWHLGLSPDTHITSYNEDARMFLQREPTERYDLIMGDAFNDFSVPYHLTTQGFNERVHAWLEPDGLYMVNIIDGAYGRFLRAYVHTLRQTFAHVYVAPTNAEWREASRNTIVIVGTDTPLDLNAFAADSLWRQWLLPAEEVDALLAEDAPVLLTDRYAPVEQMLAPVFLGKGPAEN